MSAAARSLRSSTGRKTNKGKGPKAPGPQLERAGSIKKGERYWAISKIHKGFCLFLVRARWSEIKDWVIGFNTDVFRDTEQGIHNYKGEKTIVAALAYLNKVAAALFNANPGEVKEGLVSVSGTGRSLYIDFDDFAAQGRGPNWRGGLQLTRVRVQIRTAANTIVIEGEEGSEAGGDTASAPSSPGGTADPTGADPREEHEGPPTPTAATPVLTVTPNHPLLAAAASPPARPMPPLPSLSAPTTGGRGAPTTGDSGASAAGRGAPVGAAATAAPWPAPAPPLGGSSPLRAPHAPPPYVLPSAMAAGGRGTSAAGRGAPVGAAATAAPWPAPAPPLGGSYPPYAPHAPSPYVLPSATAAGGSGAAAAGHGAPVGAAVTAAPWTSPAPDGGPYPTYAPYVLPPYVPPPPPTTSAIPEGFLEALMTYAAEHSGDKGDGGTGDGRRVRPKPPLCRWGKGCWNPRCRFTH